MHLFHLSCKAWIPRRKKSVGWPSTHSLTADLISSWGEFGNVCEVMNKNCGRKYAIKKIALNNMECREAFKELKIMKKLKSRYVVEYIDLWIEENSMKCEEIITQKNQSYSAISYPHLIFYSQKTDLLHIQMEFCCQNLNELMKNLSNELRVNDSQMMKTLCYYICCELFTEIIECLNYLHRRNVIHRDIKPANILITDGINGRFIKVSDYGLSVIRDSYDNDSTQSWDFIKYMAPEVMSTRNYDMKADIYSLGIIVEELFSLKTDL
jgi:serine/threonine protein kinase